MFCDVEIFYFLCEKNALLTMGVFVISVSARNVVVPQPQLPFPRGNSLHARRADELAAVVASLLLYRRGEIY